ncbi:MarR family winged helix-turn-helix transcriptional regulator [Actinomyces vulturis]|uniref:MarR family winged helix-turn-helix transcriptional regulator n=1 Tax=Actinomyces vulturis TaxID=1857645 RepID=UPI00082D8218|nr:MarR family transcriptional regulator [Actinomyces vulturis]
MTATTPHEIQRSTISPIQWETWKNFIYTSSHILAAADSDLQHSKDPAITMSLSDFDVLATLKSAPDHALPMAELRATVLVTTSGFSRSIRRLIERKWIVKIQSETDRRCYSLQLTSAGLNALACVRDRHHALVSQSFMDVFSDEEMATLSTLLKKLSTHLHELDS